MNKFESGCIDAFQEWYKNEERENGREFTYYQTLMILKFLKMIGIHTESAVIAGFSEIMIDKFSKEKTEHYKFDEEEEKFTENFSKIKAQYSKIRNIESPLKSQLIDKLNSSKLKNNDRAYNNAIKYINTLETKYHSWIWSAIVQATGLNEFEEPYIRSQQTEYLKYLGVNSSMTLDDLIKKSITIHQIAFDKYLNKKESDS
jgi:hypothetical protein